jgi:DUF4097 and DUF4098 domain-containing protein YvlB
VPFDSRRARERKKLMKKLCIMTLALFLAALALSAALHAERARMVEKEFKVKPGGTLEIDIDTGGDISITAWNEKKVSVTARMTGRDRDDIEIDFEETGDGIEIHARFENRKRNRKGGVDLEIKVPEEFDIAIDTKGGDVAITGVEGRLKGKTYGGDLEFVKLKGELSFTTMGGDIDVEDSAVDGRVKTMGGDVEIRNVIGDIKGHTMGGDVTYHNVSGGGGDEDEEVSITTMGGDIDVDYPDRKVKLKTFGGDIDVGKAEEVNVTTMGGDINVGEAPVGAKVSTMGGDITIRSAGVYAQAKTMGGDIEIREIDGRAKAKTMGGDITVRMVGDPDEGRRDVELESMGGDIELVVPEGLSMEFDIELSYTRRGEGKYRIKSDFDMDIEETKEWKRKWGQKRKFIYGTGSVGGGEHRIRIKTVNGNITIRKGT